MDRRAPVSIAVAMIVLCAPFAASSPAGLFHPGDVYGTGDSPRNAAVGDLDGDGDLDLAVASWLSNDVTVLLGNGNGTFEEGGSYYTGEVARCAGIGDLNGDGAPDLAVANWQSDTVSILFGYGDGSFSVPPTNLTAGNGPSWLSIDDLDGDGNLDLAVLNDWSEDVSILLGLGNGSFMPAVNYETGMMPETLTIGYLDQDDILDMAVPNFYSHDVSVLLGKGDGTFTPAENYTTDSAAMQVAIGDMNGDGLADLAVANYSGFGHENISLLFGNGDGTFGAPVLIDTGDFAFSVVLRDLDGDGITDLAVPDAKNDAVLVHYGHGDGTFEGPEFYDTGARPIQITVGDLDGDGFPDLAVVNVISDDVSILLNAMNPVRLIGGPGPGPENAPLVRVFPLVHDVGWVTEFSAYGASQYGVNVGSGDPDGDGVDEILTGAGPGEMYGPHVRGFEVEGTPLPGLSFLAYGTNKYGVNVASGELDGDGFDEIITGAGPGEGSGPHVRAWNYDGTPGVTPVSGVSFFAYGTPRWGVNVAAGDIDGDGFDEIITGAGPGAVYGPHVRGWNVDGGSATPIPGLSFLAYGTSKYGVNVTAGDVDGDGMDEIVTGAGPGEVFEPHVRGWNYDGSGITPLPGLSFFAWQTPPLRFGVNVFAGADLNHDGRDELVAGRGPDPDADTEVKVFTYDGSSVNQWISLMAFPDMGYGANAAAGRF